jgi:hypothetical protein
MQTAETHEWLTVEETAVEYRLSKRPCTGYSRPGRQSAATGLHPELPFA